MTKETPSRRAGPGRLSAEEAAELPDRLLDAAMALFSDEGYAGTTMEKIAKKAGASTKTIYSRYANKGEVLQAVVRRVVDRAVSAHDAIAADPAKVDPRTFLISLCRQVAFTIAGEAAGMNRLALAEGHRFAEFQKLHSEAFGRGSGLIRKALEVWQAAGLLPLLTEPERAAGICLGMTTDPVRIRTALGAAPLPPEAEAHVVYAVDLFLRGCGYDPKTGRPFVS
jgi:AcrR family transcriptional regulator